MQSVNSRDVLDVGLGRLALAVCLLLAIAVLVPAGLTWMGLSASDPGCDRGCGRTCNRYHNQRCRQSTRQSKPSEPRITVSNSGCFDPNAHLGCARADRWVGRSWPAQPVRPLQLPERSDLADLAQRGLLCRGA